jgi:hypothetical protein
MDNKKSHIKIFANKPDKIDLPKRLSGLARSHRLIMIEKHKEIQFMILCENIRLNDLRKRRADRQRNDRKQKRLIKVSID